MEDSERQRGMRADGEHRRPWTDWERGPDSETRAPPRSIEFECVDFCPICRTADVLRATVPAEMQQHWHAWQREVLMMARSLLDHYIAHVEAQRRRAAPVEDIPIE